MAIKSMEVGEVTRESGCKEEGLELWEAPTYNWERKERHLGADQEKAARCRRKARNMF